MKRRTFLGLLFAGGSGAAVTWSIKQDEQSETGSPAPGDSAYWTIHQEMLERHSIPEFGPNYEFEYGEMIADQVEHPAVERIRAQAAPEGDGDRLRLTPDSITADRLRTWLLAIWHVEESTQVVGTVENEAVTFRGGEVDEYTFLISVPETNTSPLWAIRAETATAARRIAGE